MVHIHNALPTELLVWIFKAGALIPAHRNELPFPLLVSRICRHWRDIVIDSPDVWTNVQWYVPSRPFPAIWFERSKSCLLDITLQVHSCYLEQDEDLDISPLIPHMDRCRRLIIDVKDDYELVELIRPLKDVFAPRLEYVEVCLREPDGDGELNEQHFFTGETPNLRSVRLRRAFLQVPPTLVGVRTLDLHEWLPSSTQFLLLGTASSLTTLVLHDCTLMNEDEDDDDDEYPVVELPSLLNLAISYPKSSPWHYPEPEKSLLRYLSLPNLEYLEIVHATIHDLINHFPIDDQKLHYPKLETLRLDSLQLAKGDIGDLLFRTLPTVSHLQLINTEGEHILPARSVSTGAGHGAASDMAATTESPRWPDLHTITLETAPTDNLIWLCDIVSTRIEMGKPLGRVRFSAVSYAHFVLFGFGLFRFSRAWFEARVEVDVVGDDELLGIIRPEDNSWEDESREDSEPDDASDSEEDLE